MKALAVCLGIVCLLSACGPSERVHAEAMNIHLSEYRLLPFTPEFSVSTVGDTLYNQRLRLPGWNRELPLTGILRVDGKAYRFMGSDSLRIQALAPLAGDSCGWAGKYLFLYPGGGWEKSGYDDSHWRDGRGAWGTEDASYVANTFWDAGDIYVRRYLNLDKETFDGRKLYIRYKCDDSLTLYCNGSCALKVGYAGDITSVQLADSIVEKLKVGENVFAAYCQDISGDALLDYGLYIEDVMNSVATAASLKSVDLQATQTHYIFQCGEVELRLDFVMPSLLQKQEVANCPVGFITYQVLATDGKQHDIEISFDLDMEWMLGETKVESNVEQGWTITQAENLYLAVKEKEMQSTNRDGHLIMTQKGLQCEDTDRGVLLIGYEEKNQLQYYGENLPHYWVAKHGKSLKDILKRVGNKYESMQKECDAVDAYYADKILCCAGKMSAERLIPYYRNFMSSHRLAAAQDGELICFLDTVGKVRDAYIDFPYLLFFERVDWMKGLLKPVFESCEKRDWSKKYPPYDIGAFPLAIRQESMEDHGVEMAADMLMMTLAVVKAENSFDYAEKHLETLSLWAGYLDEMLKKQKLPTDGLLNEGDECVKAALGLMAYKELIELRKKA